MSLEPKGAHAGTDGSLPPLVVLAPRGRPRSEGAHRAILEAFHELLIEDGFARLRLEHVAVRAGVSKATIYRRWPSKEELALELLHDLASHISPSRTRGTRGPSWKRLPNRASDA